MEKSNADISTLRREYAVGGLDRDALAADPLEQFKHWLEQAIAQYADEATAMTLATANKEGMPAARIVLLKRYDAEGFTWFTDYRSEKGQNLAENAQAELLFYWPGLERQVRIRGRVQKVERALSEQYFNERPLGSRLSAAISCQSSPVDSRQTLETAVANLQQSLDEQALACPPTWGGYLLKPERYEFWQGRPSRLHDRFIYQATAEGWQITRLQP